METQAADQRPPQPDIANRYVAEGLWSLEQTIPSLLAEAVAASADRVAVLDTRGAQLTYRQLDDRSARLAGALQRRGVCPGDVVAAQLPNRVEASVVASAITRLGAIVNPMVPVYRDRELCYMTGHCGTTALLVPGEYHGFDHDAMALRVAGEVNSVRVLASLSERPRQGIEPLHALMEEEPGEDARTNPDDPAGVLFTSGTESQPKAVLHTHNTLLSNLRSLRHLIDLDDRDNVFMASPVGHGTGFGFGILLAQLLRSTLVLQDGWEPREAARLIAEHAVGYTHGATPFVQELSEVDGVRPEDFPRFRWFVTGGASVPRGMVGNVRDRLGCTLLRLYGQTEGFMTTINRPEDPDDVLETTDGKPAPGVEVEIRDENGAPLPPGDAGEAWIRGPHRCMGFLNDPARTAAGIDEDGWLSTGDLCALNEHGSLTVVGRKKEVINRGGYKLSPREVEEVLLTHPAISRVAVVRMPDARLGEKGCAFVVLAPGQALTLAEMATFLEERAVAKYKWPERLEVVDELPMTASGKIQKFVLEQRIAAEVGG